MNAAERIPVMLTLRRGANAIQFAPAYSLHTRDLRLEGGVDTTPIDGALGLETVRRALNHEEPYNKLTTAR